MQAYGIVAVRWIAGYDPRIAADRIEAFKINDETQTQWKTLFEWYQEYLLVIHQSFTGNT